MSKKAARERRQLAQIARTESADAAERRRNRRATITAILGFLVIVGAAVAYIATNGGGGARAVSTSAVVAPAPPAGAVPRQITANITQDSQIIETPIKAKLAALRGVPVVVNQWAAWCPNCKAEFPFFQQESQRYDRQVAFVGLDAQDQRGDAVSFLKHFPVNYPSVFDPSAQQAASLGGGRGWPTTMFIDRTGAETFVHEGAYASVALLDQDIRRYALGA
jgi:thiol-disulfide isomerase/thioredoxin